MGDIPLSEYSYVKQSRRARYGTVSFISEPPYSTKGPLRYFMKSISFLQVSGYGPLIVYPKRCGLVMVYQSVCLLFFLNLAFIIFQGVLDPIHLFP